MLVRIRATPSHRRYQDADLFQYNQVVLSLMLVNGGLKHSITTMGNFSFHLRRSVSHETNHCFGISSCGMAMILQRFFRVAKPIQFHSGVVTKSIEFYFFPDGFQHVSTVSTDFEPQTQVPGSAQEWWEGEADHPENPKRISGGSSGFYGNGGGEGLWTNYSWRWSIICSMCLF